MPPSPFTRAYEEHLLKALIHSTVEDVSQKEGIGYDAVMGVLERRVSAQANWSGLSELVSSRREGRASRSESHLRT